MIGFEAPFRSRGVGEQNLEHAPGNSHGALIFTHADAELDGIPSGVPSGVRWKAKEHEPIGCSANVPMRMSQVYRRVECWIVRLEPSDQNLRDSTQDQEFRVANNLGERWGRRDPDISNQPATRRMTDFRGPALYSRSIIGRHRVSIFAVNSANF